MEMETDNQTEYYYGDEYEEEIDLESLHILSIVLYSIAFILGTSGNGLVIWITGFKMKTSVNTIWFLNLAMADFIFTFFLPLSIAYTAMGFVWSFGWFLCKLNSFIMVLTMYSSVFILTAISIDRCLSVLAAVWAQNHRTPKKAWFTCLILWALAGVFSSPYLKYRDVIKVNETMQRCSYSFGNDTDLRAFRHKALTITRFLFSFLLPIIIIISCYTAIGYRYSTIHRKRSFKPFKVIVAVIVTFFICWIPFHIFQILELKVTGDDSSLYKVILVGMPVATSIAFFNSCLNPILYVCMCQDFKEKLKKSFLKVFESAFTEETTLYHLSSRRSTVQMESLVGGQKIEGTNPEPK
ncbi:chemokine-like receptor 1 [Acipenser oxyrinchus oxyrinchus]|uniref:Chemokine-like receptor 1 n=1 Tax=Acipenser oxyrinchus oxyrinchus TaxID=40147 RepID=A0AAD8CIR1_ACIOX|nr:chemokine-like receptor 1 [Acipenser oxyrinchus oxyrinchus]